MVELLRTKCIPILLYGLDACPVGSCQLRSLNCAAVSCAIEKFLTLTVPKWLRSVQRCLEQATWLRPWLCVETDLLRELYRTTVQSVKFVVPCLHICS